MSSFIGHSLSSSNASNTNDHSHTSSLTCRSDIPAILWSIWWWNTYIKFNISSITTQLLLPYSSSTVWTTTLYITYHSHTIAPIFVSNFSINPLHRCNFLRFLYMASQLLLFNATLQYKYEKATDVSRSSRLTWIVTLFASKQCWNVSLLCFHSSPIRHCSVV